ncbi:MAG: hypothetical protein ACOC0Z_02695 [Halohasta sp.]
MSSDRGETTDENPRQHSGRTDTEVDTDAASNPLTIDLPNGSASVAEAIQAHGEVLQNPSENGLAAEEDISHLSEAVGELSQKLQQSTKKRQEAESKVDELERTVSHQQRQLQELHSVVESLMDILGTSTEWDSFESEAGDAEDTNE